MDAITPSSGFRRERTAGKRAVPRHRQHALTCSIGEIIDLSTIGLRVRCRQLLEGRIDIVLADYTRRGDLTADVVWSRPAGNFHYEIGLKFRKLTREMASRLAAIAMSHRFRKAI